MAVRETHNVCSLHFKRQRQRYDKAHSDCVAIIDMAKASILVVGGGVAGLTTATALHRRGYPTELVERQQTWRALGAGFLVHANGMRMLLGLGLAANVQTAGAVVRRWQFCDQQGELLSETD